MQMEGPTSELGRTKMVELEQLLARRGEGRIGPLQNWRMKSLYSKEMSSKHIHLGLVSSVYKRQFNRIRKIKLKHLRGLASRSADSQDADSFWRCALLRLKSREDVVMEQHGLPSRTHSGTDCGYDAAMEELLLDAGFILEQLLQHWEATAGPQHEYQLELMLLPNQIPYLLLQELIQMVKIPPAPAPAPVAANNEMGAAEYECFLRRIAIRYMVAEQASEWLLTEYTGPVYHLLHLVHLHLASAVEQPPPPRRWGLARCNCKAVAEAARSAATKAAFLIRGRCPPESNCKCKAFFSEAARSAKRALVRWRRAPEPEAGHALLRTAWWSYSLIPPARDLRRVGIRLRPKKGTRCLAAVSFRDGVLELPPVELTGFDRLLLINLVALELEWGSGRLLFLSYAVFMRELMSTQRDINLLQSNGILTLHNANPEEQEFFRDLGDLNSGREVHPHFVQLAHEIKSSYDKLNNRSATCPRSGCLS
ncbi:hypothetical protein ACQJBY_041804 [Aegilops geniculata]